MKEETAGNYSTSITNFILSHLKDVSQLQALKSRHTYTVAEAEAAAVKCYDIVIGRSFRR